jgi:hypothetical protein
MQLDAVYFILLLKTLYMFWCQQHPSSGVHKTVITASGMGLSVCTATSLQHGLVTTSNSATLERGSRTNTMTRAGGCDYSFMYS